MMAPAAMFIYSAQDALKKRDSWILEAEKKELGASGASGTFEDGYLLGLEVARVILLGNPIIYQSGLKPENLL